MQNLPVLIISIIILVVGLVEVVFFAKIGDCIWTWNTRAYRYVLRGKLIYLLGGKFLTQVSILTVGIVTTILGAFMLVSVITN